MVLRCKTTSLLNEFSSDYIFTASVIKRSPNQEVIERTEMLLKSDLCPISRLYWAKADLAD